MNNNHQDSSIDKKYSLLIPSKILTDYSLSFNEKLILGFDFCFLDKLEYNILLNTEISKLLHLHKNIVSRCRKHLIELGILRKEGRKYYLNEIDLFIEKGDQRDLVISYWIYNNKNLSTGSKLLWGEYNSISKGKEVYFASREFTADKLGCSVQSISKWTKELNDNGLFKSYKVMAGYGTKQKQIITCRFSKEGKII